MCKDNESCNCGTDTLAINKALPFAAKVRREGKHLIAPGVLARAGVMNRAYLPAEEIATSVPNWNGMPIVLRHPMKDGRFVPEGTPGASTVKIGFMANASFDEMQRLRAEYHFDTEAITALPEGAQLLAKLESGQMLEQSTGYTHDFVANAGEFNGRKYVGIQRNIKPDHVAILPDDIGACSILDGCGVLQVNQAQVMQPPTDSAMIAFFLEPQDAIKYALAAQDLPDGSEVVPAQELHVTLAYLGKVADLEQKTTERDVAQRLADIARHEVYMTAEVQGVGRFAAKDEGKNEPVWLSAGGVALHAFRQRIADTFRGLMPADKHGFTPHITLAYMPKGKALDVPMPNREAISFGSVALAWGGRVSIFRLQGEQRSAEVPTLASNKEISEMKDEKTTGQEEGAEVKAPVQKIEPVEKAAPASPMLAVNQAQVDELLALSAAIKEAGGIGNLTATLKDFAANQKTERESMIGVLAANQKLGLTAEDLATMPTPMLQRMYKAAQPTNYGVRGNELATNQDDDEWSDYVAPAEADAKSK